MADEEADLYLTELRKLRSTAKDPDIVAAISAEIEKLETVRSLVELRELRSVAKTPRVVSLLSSEIEKLKKEVVLDSVISAEAKKPTPLLLKEEPKEYDVQSPDYLSPLLQTGQAQSYPATHARALMSAAPPRKRHQFSETATAGCHMNVLLNPAEKDLSSLVTPYEGNRCFVSGVQVNDPALLPQVEASAPGGHLLGKGQSVCQVHSPDAALGYKDKVSNHSRVKIKNGYRESIGTHALKFMGVHDQRTSKVQPAPGSLRSVNLPKACFFNFEHGPSVHTAHIEISQLVQKHLQSKLSDQPCWTPPAVNYISKPLNCKICNDTINGVDSLIVCDTCEKGFHLRCLHAIDTKSIATGEWHCLTCTVPSQGEPLQKYVGGINSGATDGVKVQYVMPVSQADPLNLHPRHQPSPGLISAPSTCSADDKISLLVWKYVQPKLPEHPTWTPVKDYISKSLNCEICNITIYTVDNLLICDACERGYHLDCLQFSNRSNILRLEWHCEKCLFSGNEKPLHPKYGYIIGNCAASKVSSKANGNGNLDFSDKKEENSDTYFIHQKIIAYDSTSVLNDPYSLDQTEEYIDLQKQNSRERNYAATLSTTMEMEGQN